MVSEREIIERLERLEQPHRAMSKAVAEGVLSALKESGLTIDAQSISADETKQIEMPTPTQEPRYELPEIPGVCAIIGALPAATVLNEDALAKMLKINKRTVRRAVQRGELPPPIRFAGRSVWSIGGIVKHFEKRFESAARKDEQWRRKLASHLS